MFFKNKIRTRFAPSPTGFMHVGSLRTALYNYAFTKQNKGKFILRLEDTDRSRYVNGAEDSLKNVLKNFSLNYDEGPDNKGKFGPYIQSKRLNIYQEYADKLIKEGYAYKCFCSSENLKKMRDKQIADKLPPKYDRRCLKLTDQEIKQKLAAKTPYVVRLKIPVGKTTFNDLVRGEIKINNNTLDDQVLIKSDGFPTYHLAVVIDDYLMKITHVIRGEEWIPSTPKHIILYRLFGWPLPQFAHLPLLLNPDKSKLSKRQGDIAVEDFLAKGYLPEALLNFIALLGWNPGDNKEKFTLAEFIKEFDITKVQKGGAVFNVEKLNWMNCQYIKEKNNKELAELIDPYLKKIPNYKSKTYDIKKIIGLFKDRLEKISDISDKAEFLYKLPDYDGNILIGKKSDKNKTVLALEKSLEYLNQLKKNEATEIKNLFDKNREELGLTRAEMFWPLRVAVSGQERSPDVFDIMEILGSDESQTRIKLAIEKSTNL